MFSISVAIGLKICAPTFGFIDAASKSAKAPIGEADEVIYPKNLGCPFNNEWFSIKSVTLVISSVAGIPFSGKEVFPNIPCN